MTVFEVWAPGAARVELLLDPAASGSFDATAPRRAMAPAGGGWWRLDAPEAAHGTDYAFSLDGGERLADPRSAWQPYGVHGPSRVFDPATPEWHDEGWTGRPLAGSVVYETHIGTFTPEGTFDAAIGRLDHLVELGVGHVEVMPVAGFNGARGWGYDGVALWAVHEPYGGPAGFARFVDACHARGLGVVLDVVYNHLGPSGNRLAEFGPYFTGTHHTPWGAAVNLDAPGSDEVRRFVIGNALRWLREFHVDGLRLDAVHALVDDRATHLLEELSAAVDAYAAACGRPLFLVAESDRNDPRTVTPREAGGLGLHAQWDDDVHHALHALVTGETGGYYADFGADPYAATARTLTRAFFHDGTASSFRGRAHGRPVDRARTPGSRFVVSTQTHDQIGNRATGDRLAALCSPGLVCVAAALVLTSPYTPMLFMGEEWGAATPWQYFTDHGESELAAAVREGRRREFAAYGWSADAVPDPQDPATFARSRLDWSEPEREPHAAVLAWYRTLIALRAAEPELADPRLDAVRVDHDAAARRLVVTRGTLRVACNLADGERVVPLGVSGAGVAGQVLAASAGAEPAEAGVRLAAESVAIVRVTPDQS